MAGIRGVDYIDENGDRVLTGGLLAREKNLAKNPNHYRDIGATGGKVTGVKKGFAANPELARKAGSIGGKKSKRGKAVAKEPVVLEDNGGVEPTPHNGFEPVTEKKKKLWIF